MAGYFKVSMDAARAIVEVSECPRLLAGYITLCAYAFGDGRAITAAGAKSIRQTIGCTDHRSKRILADLCARRFGERADKGLIHPTSDQKRNARIYRIERWDGEDAYLPALLVERLPNEGSTLERLLTTEGRDQETIRDALLLLLHIYATVDYAEWFGCPPDLMVCKSWQQDGTAGDDFQLGLQGQIGSFPLSLVAESESWSMPAGLAASLYSGCEGAATARLWQAVDCLKKTGLIVAVASVQTSGRAYPLWVYNASYRDSLRRFGIVPDLAKEMHRAAGDSGVDDCNMVMRYAVNEMEGAGSGLFYCAGNHPTVRTVIAPRLHAPTPINLDDLRDAAETTTQLWEQVNKARRIQGAA